MDVLKDPILSSVCVRVSLTVCVCVPHVSSVCYNLETLTKQVGNKQAATNLFGCALERI